MIKEMNLANDGSTSRDVFDWEYILWEVRLKLLAAGFFIYLGMFLLAHWLSSWISVSYRALSAEKKSIWSMDIVRGVFGVQCWIAGFWALHIDPVFQTDKVYSQQNWSWFHCFIASGHMLFDNVFLLVSIIVFGNSDMILFVHHFFASGALLGLIINIKSGHYLFLIGLLLEMITPFNCIFTLLSKSGRTNTFFWKVNLWVHYHVQHCRVVLTYHMWWVCISNWNNVMENLGLPHFIFFLMGLSTLTFILNPYWIYTSTPWLFRSFDKNSPNTEPKNGSSGNLNSEMLKKKRK
ncbi:protein CLN8-like [Carettochelys insculpta]|uniref:protein CLN8-like n=1 Tax=Carettochelys insculpta TaxID=44489 RepID=UPI003EBF3335